MKKEDLQALGLDEEQIAKVLELKGKAIAAEQKRADKAEADRDQWKARAEAAEETLKGFDGVDVEGLNKQIEDWKNKAEQAEKDYQKKIEERDFADALKTKLDEIKFTSDYAKTAVMNEIIGEGLKLKDGVIIGFDDVIKRIREKDASAFAAEGAPAKFTDVPKDKPGAGGKKSLRDLTLDERIKLKRTNPDYYNQLRKGE